MDVNQPCKISSDRIDDGRIASSSYSLGTCQQINQPVSSFTEPVYGCVASGALGFKGVVGETNAGPSAD